MADAKKNGNQPDVLLLGGTANSLSVARSLGKNGINVSIAAPENCIAAKSKYIQKHYIKPENIGRIEFYVDLLLRQDCIDHGTVVYACGDYSITAVATNKNALTEKYILDIQKPEHQLALLDKQKTLDLAKSVNCPSPGYWNINTIEDVKNAEKEITYPVLIKPIHSHLFHHRFNKKLFYAENRKSLIGLAGKALDAGIEIMLCEYIPGPDNLLSSYYVYIDKDKKQLFEYTKQIIRRSPENFGLGTYHRSIWLPETAAIGLKFFSGIDFTGMGNIEFKYDLRDMQYKVMECNARFTAAQELVTRSGVDMPNIIYQYLTKGDRPEHVSFKDGVTLLFPLQDFDAFRDLYSAGKISLGEWLLSLLRIHVFSHFALFDIKPFIIAINREMENRVVSKLKKLSRNEQI